VERTGDEFGSRASDGGGATERVFSRMQSIDFNMRCGGGSRILQQSWKVWRGGLAHYQGNGGSTGFDGRAKLRLSQSAGLLTEASGARTSSNNLGTGTRDDAVSVCRTSNPVPL
jgi:hypothetical protein